jgi:hypothetical protein
MRWHNRPNRLKYVGASIDHYGLTCRKLSKSERRDQDSAGNVHGSWVGENGAAHTKHRKTNSRTWALRKTTGNRRFNKSQRFYDVLKYWNPLKFTEIDEKNCLEIFEIIHHCWRSTCTKMCVEAVALDKLAIAHLPRFLLLVCYNTAKRLALCVHWRSIKHQTHQPNIARQSARQSARLFKSLQCWGSSSVLGRHF